MDDRINMEWLETNGLGGWASSTVLGTNTRRYHGLLVAATDPPTGRTSLLSKLDETVKVGNFNFPLGVNQYKDGILFPCGNLFLSRFEHTFFPEFYYEAGGLTIKKTIASINFENSILVIYEILSTPDNAIMEFQPMVSGRDYHSLLHANDSINKDFEFKNGILRIQPYSHDTLLYISIPGSEFESQPDWYNNFEYEGEKSRGQDYLEDLYTPGILKKEIREGEIFGIIVSTVNPDGRDALKLFAQEKRRREKLLSGVPAENELIKKLILASDQFIVNRNEDKKTIIAGYHWFTDWGRDTMIALPGLTLSTGRFEDAKMIFRAFAANIDHGMIPNRFPDTGKIPEYNTIDASLWFFVAVWKYYEKTKDKDFIMEIIFPAFREIINHHMAGTRFNIHTDDDGLLEGGEAGTQLTWMDAKVGEWVVTPRIGKAVEINALWYNALVIYSRFLEMAGSLDRSVEINTAALNVKQSFINKFWNAEKGYLYDVIDGENRDDALRPNQIFALSLPFPLLEGEKAEKVFLQIKNKLFTPFGLRSLSPDHTLYKPYYSGNQYERDGAYHQGTVWSWLLGPYIDALVKLYGENGVKEASQIIACFRSHLDTAGIGTISEIFDGNEPFRPVGCIAQAWSVGEILRVCVEYKLV